VRQNKILTSLIATTGIGPTYMNEFLSKKKKSKAYYHNEHVLKRFQINNKKKS